jgi:hypothetical protein
MKPSAAARDPIDVLIKRRDTSMGARVGCNPGSPALIMSVSTSEIENSCEPPRKRVSCLDLKSVGSDFESIRINEPEPVSIN